MHFHAGPHPPAKPSRHHLRQQQTQGRLQSCSSFLAAPKYLSPRAQQSRSTRIRGKVDAVQIVYAVLYVARPKFLEATLQPLRYNLTYPNDCSFSISFTLSYNFLRLVLGSDLCLCAPFRCALVCFLPLRHYVLTILARSRSLKELQKYLQVPNSFCSNQVPTPLLSIFPPCASHVSRTLNPNKSSGVLLPAAISYQLRCAHTDSGRYWQTPRY